MTETTSPCTSTLFPLPSRVGGAGGKNGVGEGKERGEECASDEEERECGAGMVSGVVSDCGRVGSEEVVGREAVGER